MSEEEIYAPPTMPVYVDRLVADTQDLSAEEFGVYWLLCLRQWPKGSIPQDNTRQAHIGRVSPKKMRAIRAAIGSRLQPHPTKAGAVYSPFMEEVRREMEARNKKASDAGRKGAAKRWQTDGKHNGKSGSKTDGDAIAKPWQTDEFQSPISSDQLASLADSAREASYASQQRNPKSPAFGFCGWFLRAGIEAGAIGPHFGMDPYAWSHSQIEPAETLLSTYGEPECRKRSEALFRAKNTRLLRRAASVSALLEFWDSEILRDDPPPAQRGRRVVGLNDADVEGL